MTMALTEEERQVARVLKDEQKEVDGPAEVELHDDRTKETRTPNFARMRADWSSGDAARVQAMGDHVTRQLMVKFADLYELLNDFNTIVRTPVVDQVSGELEVDRFGMPVWERTGAGNYIEDWTKLSDAHKRDFLFSITSRVVEWRQKARECWMEAMIAKVQWEEVFTVGYLDQGGRTVEDRTQNGRRHALGERYFAIFKAAYSRGGDDLVEGMKLLGMRISQSINGD